MIEINEKNHISVLITSLNKIYNQGKLNGKLKSIDVYLINIIYKLLTNCCIELTTIQQKQLFNLYTNLYFYSQEICRINYIESYIQTYRIPFIQAEAKDCNDYPIADKIYYWQEENYLTTIDDIISLVDNQNYFLNKSFDTKEVFEIGKNVDYNNIGRICFAITETSLTETYKIYDQLNNDVTHTFDRVFIDSINVILFVSQNIYSHGTIFFKIKKTTDVFNNRIFNNIFNNIFD